MTVQAQYPANLLFLHRREEERKDMELPKPPSAFVDPSPAVFFSSNGGSGGNPRKRGREIAVGGGAPMAHGHHVNHLFSLQSHQIPPLMMSLSQMQSQPSSSALVSTGLRLAFEDQQHNQSRIQSNPILSDELAALINQQKEEIDRFLHAQTEQLRRAVAERRRSHYRTLLRAAEDAAARRIKEKEAELDRAARRRAELEDRIGRLRTESATWQAKAMAQQAQAAALHVQLQQAAAATPGKAAEECGGESDPAEDAESAHVDPGRVEPDRACRACRVRPVSVVLLPCRHLCLCETCELTNAVNGEACPICRCVRTGSVQVFLS
ncbi:BOI-related E3 ubiquitin-protein ligase 1-like [Typha latifolia]|uniref:BOI-related E3 ubiquitin-protein ligase 1-like n=1 Tax=Typha latifolia TaxID=4733 RepID=UPI003C300931